MPDTNLNLYIHLNTLTLDNVKDLAKLLPKDESKKGLIRKADLIRWISQTLTRDLEHHYQSLNEAERCAIAEAIYSPNQKLDHRQFEAKYPMYVVDAIGDARDSWHCGDQRKNVSLCRLFFYNQQIPLDLASKLRAFIAQPKAKGIDGQAAPPEEIEGCKLTVCLTENPARADISTLLRLAFQGKIEISEKTNGATAKTIRLLNEQLALPDFYLDESVGRFQSSLTPNRSFAWPLLLLAGKLVSATGKKMVLTKLGQQANRKPFEDTIKSIWHAWLTNKLIDEFSRIDNIKGKKSRDTQLTPPADRRQTIHRVLQHCSAGLWISFDDFSQHMRAAGQVFEVATSYWGLYFCDPEYGSLGYFGYHDWPIVQDRYMMCVLFEYAATLGLIDIAFTHPQELHQDYGSPWGTDDLDYLSRYDGLAYFRITPLGAYCLDITKQYESTQTNLRHPLSVLPSGSIKLIEGGATPELSFMLAPWTEQEDDTTWRLDRGKIVESIVAGYDLTNFEEWLVAQEGQPLPECVEALFRDISHRANALKITDTAILIDCIDEKTAIHIAEHVELKKLCFRSGKKQLVVKSSKELAFRKQVKVFGYGLR